MRSNPPNQPPEPAQDREQDSEEDDGCAFVLAGSGKTRAERFCGAPRRPGSVYCPRHHARCRLRGGSAAERQRLHEIEALAAAVGGRRGDGARRPPPQLLRRLERIARAFSRPKRSRIVRGEEDGDTARP